MAEQTVPAKPVNLASKQAGATISVPRQKMDAYGTRYFGCAASLVEAGIVRAEQLPGKDGPRKKSAVYYNGQPARRGCSYPRDESYMQITLIGRDRFSVWIPASYADRRRKAMVDEHLLAIAAHQEAAKKELSSIPNSPHKYREDLLDLIDTFTQVTLFTMEPTTKHGFSFNASAKHQVRVAAQQLRSAIEGGMVLFDASHHDKVQACLRERAGLPPERPRLRLVKGTEGV